jgi:hypothetical protein
MQQVAKAQIDERLLIVQLGAVFCLAGYSRALRGEEITKFDFW